MKSTDMGHKDSDISLGSTCTHVPTLSLPNRNLLTRHLLAVGLSLVAEIGSSLLHCIFLKQGPYRGTLRALVSTHKKLFVIQKLKILPSNKSF